MNISTQIFNYKSCTKDVQSISLPSQKNILTQSHQYSFGMNCIDNDINFEFSSIEIPTVPQFGFEQQKMKVNLFPPQALRAAFDDSNMFWLDFEETIEQQINQDIDCPKQIKRFQSQDDYSNAQKSIRMRYINGSNLTASSEAQLQQQQQSQRSIQKQRQLVWDCRTVNKELQQKKRNNSNSKTYFQQPNQDCLDEKEQPKKKTYSTYQFNQARENNQTKPNEKKNSHPTKIKKDEFVQQKVKYQQESQRIEFLKCD